MRWLRRKILSDMRKSNNRERAACPIRQLTRRDFVIRTAGGVIAWSTASGLRLETAEAAGPPPTAVLVNESYLRRKYPNDVASLLGGLEQFALRHNANLLFVEANAAPSDIKAQLLRYVPRPERLLIFGDDEAIPRLKINWKNNFIYFFKGDKYVRHNLVDGTFGALKPIAGNWPGLPASWASRARTALSWHDNTVYFVKGTEYVKYNLGNDTAGATKPMAGNWHGLPTAWTSSGLDAAVNWGNGKAYFFRSGEYLRYDIANDRADDRYPRPLTPQQWPNWPADWTSGIDAGVQSDLRRPSSATAKFTQPRHRQP